MMHAFWAYLLEASPWLLLGFAVAGAMHVLAPQSLMQRWLGAGRKWAVVRAAAIGVPLPLCSCSVIPAAAALRAGGASRGASAAFAISTPEVDAPSIALTWGMIGPWLAIARPIAALATAVGVGWAVDRMIPDGTTTHAARTDTSGCCHTAQPVPGASCCARAPENTHRLAGPWSRGATFSLITLPRNLAVWILLGLALSAAVSALVPPDWFTQIAHIDHTGALTKLAALVIGVPWYVCATASTPLAAALIAAGLSPGAALVFLLAGPATNPATMGWVFKDLGVRALAIYLAGIALTSLAAGFALDLVIPVGAIHATDAAAAHDHGTPLHTASAFVLLALLVPGAMTVLASRFNRRASDAHACNCAD